jgi:RNA polymerase sigma factor (sigma-70 family)
VTAEEQRLARLDRDGLAAAFDAHAQDVFRYLARRCEDRALAEDLMSAVFLEAWRARDRAVLVDGTLRPWLLGIAANVLRNSCRSLRRQRAALDRYRARADRLVEPDHAEGVADRADAARTRAELDAAFARLSAKDRAVADLCLVEGLNAEQAAVALGLPVGTVKSRLAHARGRLRGALRPGEPAPGTDPMPSAGHGQDERHVGAPAESAAP